MRDDGGFSTSGSACVCPAVCPRRGSSAGLGDILPPGGGGVGVDVRQVVEESRRRARLARQAWQALHQPLSASHRIGQATPRGGASTDATPIATTNGLGRTHR